MAGFHHPHALCGAAVIRLYYHQPVVNALAQDGFHGLGHGRASLPGADHKDTPVAAEIITLTADGEYIPLAM